MNQPLLLTKFNRPPCHERLVVRPELLAKLEPQAPSRLTLVSAPPGFGKTMLVSQWLDGLQDTAIAWLSLDDDDNDPARFWAYVLAALDRACPNEPPLSAHLAPLVSSKALVATLLNDLAERSRPVVLVLDDYHVIRTPEIHETLTWWLDHMPANLRLVLTTRADPPLPVARLRARRHLNEVRAGDLRFTAEDTATFLVEIMGVPLGPESVRSLFQRTEGWIAGLQLAGLSLQNRPHPDRFVDTFAGSHRYIMDYLVEEVLDRQDERLQSFLLETSVLDRLSAPLCEAVTGRPDSVDVLERLEEANLLLVPLDDSRQWYRYHHLFADMLRHILARRQPDRVALLQGKAADWCESQGLLREAIAYRLRAGDFDGTAELLAEADALWRHGEVQTLLGWLAALPDAVLAERPSLLLLRAWALVPSGRVDTLAMLAQQTRAALARQATPSPVHAAQLLALEAHVARWQEDAPTAVRLAQQALDSLPTEDWMWRGIVTLALAASHRLVGDLPHALESYAALAEECRRRHEPYFVMIAECMRASILAEQGALGQALEAYEDALAYAAPFGGTNWDLAGYALVGMGEILRERGDLDRALDHLLSGVETGGSLPQVAVPGYLSLMRLHWGRGEPNLAAAALAKAEGGVGPAPPAMRLHAAGTALWHAWTAPELAARWRQTVDPRAEAQALQEPRRMELGALARLLLALGQHQEALSLLDDMRGLAERTGRTALLIETLVLRALGLSGLQRGEEALQALAHALRLGVPEGYQRLFLDEGAPMRALLAHVHPRLEGDVRARVEGWLGAKPAPVRATARVDDLSEREREVLHLIARGTTNQAIADALGIELSTAKKHCSNILGKLGTSNRTEAVARARELNLL